MATHSVPDISREFRNVTLGDERLDKRLTAIVERAASAPSASFPKMMSSVAEREAFYRFIDNERVAWEAILTPHVGATVDRCRPEGFVRIAHDTMFSSFEGDREGLGPLAGKKRGFGAHFSLAVSANELRAPLGILALSPFVRQDKPKVRTKEERAARVKALRQTPRSEKESARWLEGALVTEERLGPQVACLHVMDQEADDFALLADLVQHGLRFVVRGSATRCVNKAEGIHVGDVLSEVTAQAFRTVPLTARTKPGPNHVARGERMAILTIRATTVMLPRPQHTQHETQLLHLNVVQVFEPNPPPDTEPVEWTLYTTEPIETADELAAIVDHYRARWRIEELHKAIKTGCSFEKRQLGSYDALVRALALLTPVAWRMLALRTLAREAPHRPASELVDDVQIQVLRFLAQNYKIPPCPTVRDVMLAIADVGGHIRQNGDPGWIVLGRGFEDFVKAEAAWRAALAQAPRSDQS